MAAYFVGTDLAYACYIVTLVRGEWEPNALFRHLHLLARMQGLQGAVIDTIGSL